MRKLITGLLGCVAAVVAFGYFAVQHQGAGSRAAKKAAVELFASQGSPVWVTTQLIAQRPSFVRQVVELTGLADEQAGRVTDEIFIPELTSHVGEVTQAIEDAWAASFSAHDLHTLQRCWLLLSHVETAKVQDINDCESSHAARMLAAERPIINKRIQTAGLQLGLKWFPAALSGHRDQLRDEGIVAPKGARL